MPYASRTIGAVIDDVNRSYLLPAIQRPFVWSSAQVVALFDSLLKGYCIRSHLHRTVPTIKPSFRCHTALQLFYPDVLSNR